MLAGLSAEGFPIPGERLLKPGAVGCEIVGKCGASADDPAAAAGREPSSFSEGALVGADEGSTGTPGGDCAPGSPGNENRLLADGKEVGKAKGGSGCGPVDGIDGSTAAEETLGSVLPDKGVGNSADDARMVMPTFCVSGTVDTTAGAGLPGTDTPGTLGKEYISLAAGMVGPTAKGSGLDPSDMAADGPNGGGVGIPGAIVPAAVGEGAAARSAPLGEAVGGEESADGIPGKEYISVAGGIAGAAAQGPAFTPSETSADDPGKAGSKTAGCDASPVEPASEAAMARKSASFKGPKGRDEGDSGAVEANGTLGAVANDSTSRGRSGTVPDRGAVPEIASQSTSPGGEIAAVGCAGSAAKNSLARRAITAGSGNEGKVADKF